MIHLDGVTKRFRAGVVLDGLSMHLDRGERVAVLGLNGAGKTTLMRCLLGLTGFRGRITVDGLDARQEGKAVRARIGYVPQRAPMFPGTVDELIAFVSELRGVPLPGVRERLAQLGLDVAAHGPKPVAALSGGMMQKVVLGLALAEQVEILVLDEPTANLDPRARRDVLQLVNRAPPDTTVVLASHRLSDVIAVSRRVIVLHEGRVAFDGSLDAFRALVPVEPILWVELEHGARDRVADGLKERYGADAVRRNGAALGVPTRVLDPAAALVALRDLKVEMRSCWTETPSLDDILDTLVGAGRIDGRQS